ncbi:GNAT family N-acetyltransferase [Sphingomonas japonica]|uniref:RimJ/RimL family protein N-acetyltransferase n=1 Tax=Sphingomonas japonica TaxID=511662 RepID=A0ABX0TZD5_9SPHN|nr:GNAT family N-acetyltransferase [Sphingomonas japonica]NIJ23200.1 RimJ/RimL family protein N-acetyltransferase [Sphingomonas japonica]
MNGPVLFTERLVLRLPETSDLDGWAEMSADEETMRFIGGTKPRSQAWRDLCAMRGAWDIKGFAMFSVIERATGRWIGRIGPWQPEGWPGTEVGWGLARDSAGRGYAHEAAVACMDYAVDILGWRHIIHTIDPANARSIALARRLGSTNGGRVSLPAPYEHETVDAWGQTAEQWRNRTRD